MIHVVTKDGQVIPASECVVVVLEDEELHTFLAANAPEHRYKVARANRGYPLLSVIP